MSIIHFATLRAERDAARAECERLRWALQRIGRWFGEFPPSRREGEDGKPMSYGAAFGSNGERDFMRRLARAALDGRPQGDTQ